MLTGLPNIYSGQVIRHSVAHVTVLFPWKPTQGFPLKPIQGFNISHVHV